MRHLPLFFDLRGRLVLVAGGTDMAANRARLALEAGAAVRIFAAEPGEAVKALVVHPRVSWVPGEPASDDLAAADLVLGATGSESRDRAIAEAARAAGVPVNVADRADLCDFIMPAIVARGEVTIGISTNGAAPALARWLRAAIERALPARLGELARFCGAYRAAAKASIPGPARRRFWERVIDGPIGAAVLAGRSGAARQAMLCALNSPGRERATPGIVHIVGAGPGDPELLTLRALHLLQQADVIVHDELVAAEILAYARRDAERIHAGKSNGHPGIGQAAINALLLAHARAGKRVVRLKGGDPFIFGRGGEELEFLRANGIETEIVPGITAALGCAASSRIPLTHRDHASALILVSGHAREGAAEHDWTALARPDRTLAVYMGLSNARAVADRLIAAGLPPDTPVAIIERGTRPDERVLKGTLASLPELAAQHDAGPALIVIGTVAGFAQVTESAPLEEAA
jgi:uroporphyrin-III C-methyltransferase/precorrin-2 dehydrogenase/sirohydrochlorin ferrochelatase